MRMLERRLVMIALAVGALGGVAAAELRKGYGLADVGLEAPARADTAYHVVGPVLPFTGIAVLQLHKGWGAP